ncbi:MAG: hypothetical protein F9K23_05010 [Bacteroidetes bacterium]|nr:MAG: hypothetical protein F9K23_05010 [Bacteroidota bacterium]
MRKYIWEIIIGGVVVAIIAGLVLLYIQFIKDYEHRLTKLEKDFEHCVDCSKRTKTIGDYPYTVYTGVDVASNGEVLLNVQIDLLSEQFRWRCGSITEIVRGDDVVDIGKVIRQYHDNAELENALGIVCIGTASSEGQLIGEQTRAGDRVETLINLVSSNLNSSKRMPIYGLNFGKHIGSTNTPCSDATLEQRRVILIKLIERSDKLTDDKLEESLKRILLEKASNPAYNFPIDIRNYSMFRNNEKMLIYGRNQK